MKRNLLLAVMLWVAAGGAWADEASMCKSMCASDQTSCRKDAVKLTDLDKDVLIPPEEKNPLARAASQGQFATAQAKAAEADDFHRRRSERTGKCDTAYQRCVRTCGSSDASAGSSEVLTKQGQAKRSGAKTQ